MGQNASCLREKELDMLIRWAYLSPNNTQSCQEHNQYCCRVSITVNNSNNKLQEPRPNACDGVVSIVEFGAILVSCVMVELWHSSSAPNVSSCSADKMGEGRVMIVTLLVFGDYQDDN
mmetsp:Transcript_15533/g.20880  ORF Transcript_15533/g.20880 Transcript_15533/m.20880 type:complete len:118 (+) Transcript_15533:283-636(+)